MANKKIRVLVVDDSSLVRAVLSDMIEATPDMQLAGTAANGEQALAKIETLHPDVITLDVQMPKMDGLQTLDALLARRPMPVVMVSSLTSFGAETTFEALQRGAVDYVAKPEGDLESKSLWRQDILRKVRIAAGTDIAKLLARRLHRANLAAGTSAKPIDKRPTSSAASSVSSLADKCIVIGISTGGPPALASLLSAIQGPLPPMVIVQHMPASFTGPFAARLDKLGPIRVKEAATGDILEPNHAYVAPGGLHLQLRRHLRGAKVLIREGDPVSGHRPSVDVAMLCAAEIYGDRSLGLIMTGMGRDGVEGCRAIRAAGGYVLGQDGATSDVYGMNKAAFQEGHVDRQFSLDDTAATIIAQVRKQWPWDRHLACHEQRTMS